MLLFSFVGLLLLRLEEARLLELLFHDPPRNPRNEPENQSRPPASCRPALTFPANTERRSPSLWAWAAWATHATTLCVTRAARVRRQRTSQSMFLYRRSKRRTLADRTRTRPLAYITNPAKSTPQAVGPNRYLSG